MSAVEQASDIQRMTHDQLGGFNNLDLSGPPSIQISQSLRSDSAQYRFEQTVSFASTAALGQGNTVFLPTMPCIIDDLTLQFKMGAAATSTNPCFIPTFRWISSLGVSLLYKNSVIYTASQAEIELMHYINNDIKNLWTDMVAENERAALSAAAGYYFLRLPSIAKILKFCGPVQSYSSNDWSIQVGLLPASQIVGGSSSLGTTSITSMELVVSGTRASPEYSEKVRSKLNNKGLLVHFEQSNYQRDVLASADTTNTLSYPQLEGNVSALFILNRLQSIVDGTSAALTSSGLAAVCPYDQPGNGDLIDVGTNVNPLGPFGKDLVVLGLTSAFPGTSTFSGALDFVNVDGTYGPPYSVAGKALGIIPVSFSNNFSYSNDNGASSGHFYWRNNGQVILKPAAAWGADLYADSVIFITRNLLIRADGAIANNAY